MLVDVEHLRGLSAEFADRMDALMRDIYVLAGGEFNINSPPQLRTVLFERLGLSTRGVKKGKTGLSTDVDVLTRLAAEHPLPAKILDYRALSKLKSTYLDALPLAVNPATGRLHTSFNQSGAATGRLSSSEPNLQNIPIRGEEGVAFAPRSSRRRGRR
jgi:DNA polymerase-1